MSLPTLDDVEKRVADLLDSGIPPARIILIEEHHSYPGYLSLEPLDETARGVFYGGYTDWMSRHLILNELHLAHRFFELLEQDGYYVFWTPSTEHIKSDIERWSRPLEIEGYTLRPFQNFPSIAPWSVPVRAPTAPTGCTSGIGARVPESPTLPVPPPGTCSIPVTSTW